MNSSILSDDFFSSISFPNDTRRILIAYSGGLDSHALLHLISGYKNTDSYEIIAIHVNHGLSKNAALWARHCRAVCSDLKINFRLLEIDASCPKGESPEAWARKLRYQAIQGLFEQGDILLTAHHLEDMAETVLIQLFRGSGPAGLAAMPRQIRFGEGWLYRPLLNYSRDQLQQYAVQNRLKWIEDESNTETRYARNYLRNKVFPLIRQRWPAIAKTLSRAAKHQADAATLLDELAKIDLHVCASNQDRLLSVNALTRLSMPRAANLIRFWIRINGFPIPTDAQLAQIFSGVIAAKPEAEACVAWRDTEVRRYRDALFIITPLPDPPDQRTSLEWDITTICKLEQGELQAVQGTGMGLKADICRQGHLTVKYRSGGELLGKGGHHHSLKKIFQQHGVPSCYRDYIPLIYVDNNLAAITGIMVDQKYAARPDEDSWQIYWSLSDKFSLNIPA